MKFGLELRTALGQTLTPQQIQYLKLLQMPVLQLESQVRQEIELNPMLEDAEDYTVGELSSDSDDQYDEYKYNNEIEEVRTDSKENLSSYENYNYEDNYNENKSSQNYNETGSYDDFNSNESKFQDKEIDDKLEPFEFHKMLWDGGEEYGQNYNNNDDDDNEPFQIKDNSSLTNDLTQQLTMLNLSKEELFLGQQIIGNIDDDGYLRRDLSNIVEETNDLIKEINFEVYYKEYQKRNEKVDNFVFETVVDVENDETESIATNTNTNNENQNSLANLGIGNKYYQEFAHLFNKPNEQTKAKKTKKVDFGDMHENPALKYALSPESAKTLTNVYQSKPEIIERLENKINSNSIKKIENYTLDIKAQVLLKEITIEDAEKVLKCIQNLEPAGIGSRSIQECLLAQLHSVINPNPSQLLAKDILEDHYDAFSKKHYTVIVKAYGINEDVLRDVIDEIKRLNPRPGGGDYQSEMNTVIPDFSIEIEDKTNDILITVNDGRLPALKLSKAYQNMKKEAKFKLYNKETRDWIRNKYEDAKFLIQALRQRKNTMLKVMTSIAGLQKDFFTIGPSSLKPLIYKDVAEDTGLDISTVCRIVNGKYVQTDFGTFELKYYFSESLPTDEGEEVSTRVIKQILKEIIDTENKTKPFSDDKLSKYLKKRGYNVARRTVAKYREQLKIPVARLRKEI